MPELLVSMENPRIIDNVTQNRGLKNRMAKDNLYSKTKKKINEGHETGHDSG